MTKAFIISGPTASGKSALALRLAAARNVAIINADALQVYRGLPILSSQPSAAEQKLAPHFLYSHFLPQESCSVVTWLELVKSTVEAALQQNKIPLIVGGSGMYISKLLDGIAEIPLIDEALKTKARQLYENLGREEFIANLIALGEDEEKIKSLDKQRLIRVYEVLQQTAKSLFWWQERPNKFVLNPQIFTHINLDLPREKLYQNCNLRFEKMLQEGALEEVKVLEPSASNLNWQITKTLGFQEIKDFLAQKISHEKLISIATQHTRNYAKRQLTWFRHQFKNKNTFDDTDLAYNFLQNLSK